MRSIPGSEAVAIRVERGSAATNPFYGKPRPTANLNFCHKLFQPLRQINKNQTVHNPKPVDDNQGNSRQIWGHCRGYISTPYNDATRLRFADLFKGHQKELTFFALKMTREINEAEELVQCTYARCFEKFDLGFSETRGSFKSWASTIMRNLFLDQIRFKWKYHQSIDEEIDEKGTTIGDLFGENSSDPSQSLERHETIKIIKKCISTLKSKERQMVEFRYYHRLDYQQIADLTGVPLGTVKASLHNARRKIKTRFHTFSRFGRVD